MFSTCRLCFTHNPGRQAGWRTGRQATLNDFDPYGSSKNVNVHLFYAVCCFSRGSASWCRILFGLEPSSVSATSALARGQSSLVGLIYLTLSMRLMDYCTSLIPAFFVRLFVLSFDLDRNNSSAGFLQLISYFSCQSNCSFFITSRMCVSQALAPGSNQNSIGQLAGAFCAC